MKVVSKDDTDYKNLGDNSNIPDYYVNSVTFMGSLYEFMLTFGLKSDPDKDPNPSVIIRMSPQHTKVFVKLLSKNVEEYEKNIGPISLPQKLIDDLGIK
jgi:hypothetical protein